MARSVADEIMTVMASRAFVCCVVNGVILYLVVCELVDLVLRQAARPNR